MQNRRIIQPIVSRRQPFNTACARPIAVDRMQYCDHAEPNGSEASGATRALAAQRPWDAAAWAPRISEGCTP